MSIASQQSIQMSEPQPMCNGFPSANFDSVASNVAISLKVLPRLVWVASLSERS